MFMGLTMALIFSAQAAQPDYIAKARQVFVGEGRKQALDQLESALVLVKKAERSQIIIEGEKLATRFRTDESQSQFEEAESIYFARQDGALKHYEAAEKIEPDNIQIAYAKLRYFLSKSKCSRASKILLKLKEVWRHSMLMPYYRIRIQECEGKSISPTRVKALNVPQPYLTKLKIQALVDKGKGKQALKLWKSSGKIEKQFSENYYWLYRAGELDAGGRMDHLRKYLKLCQSYGAVERRSFKLEPLLCSRVEEVQATVRSKESGGV